MGKYNIDVIRTDTFEIEIDEDVWNEEELKDWSNTFWEVEGVEGLAKSLAGNIARQSSSNGFFEGFGYVQILNKDGTKRTVWDGMDIVDEADLVKGISVRIVSEDEDCEAVIN